MYRIALVAGLLVSTAALGDGTRLEVEVEVDQVVEREVGYAMGWFCDDPALVIANLATRNDRNVWTVQGVKVGVTRCRVGTDPSRPHVVFEVHVIGKKKPR